MDGEFCAKLALGLTIAQIAITRAISSSSLGGAKLHLGCGGEGRKVCNVWGKAQHLFAFCELFHPSISGPHTPHPQHRGHGNDLFPPGLFPERTDFVSPSSMPANHCTPVACFGDCYCAACESLRDQTHAEPLLRSPACFFWELPLPKSTAFGNACKSLRRPNPCLLRFGRPPKSTVSGSPQGLVKSAGSSLVLSGIKWSCAEAAARQQTTCPTPPANTKITNDNTRAGGSPDSRRLSMPTPRLSFRKVNHGNGAPGVW